MSSLFRKRVFAAAFLSSFVSRERELLLIYFRVHEKHRAASRDRHQALQNLCLPSSRGPTQNPATERGDVLKIQQLNEGGVEREREREREKGERIDTRTHTQTSNATSHRIVVVDLNHVE